MILVLRVGARGLAEFLIEKHSADAGNVRQHAVKHFSRGFILIESLADEIAQVTAALRDSERERRVDAAGGILRALIVLLGVTQEGHEVARRRKPDAERLRVFGWVIELIEHAGLGLGAGRQEPDGAVVDEFPAVRGNALLRIGFPDAHRELRLLGVEARRYAP